MKSRRRATVSELRQVIDCLPRRTRIAMLRGIASNGIIAGAYADGGGICPMLAAHRAGGRTNMIAFAHAWDRFAFRDSRSKRSRRARRATERELSVLRTQLEASLMENEGEFALAAREYRELVARRRKERERRTAAHGPQGWAWLRVFRRYDEYERALARLNGAEEQREREPVALR